MGLDMRLFGVKYVYADKKINYLFTELAYFSKCNQIHGYLVDKFQEGNDDLRFSNPIFLSDLKDLLLVCREVLSNHDKAEELLPTRKGFFYGGHEYDEFYFKKLQHVFDKLNYIVDQAEEDRCFDYFIYEGGN